jgi:hypothetical protein
VVALLALAEAVFTPDTLVLLLSRSHRQSHVLFRKVVDFYDTLGVPLLKRLTTEELVLTDGCPGGVHGQDHEQAADQQAWQHAPTNVVQVLRETRQSVYGLLRWLSELHSWRQYTADGTHGRLPADGSPTAPCRLR